MKTVELKGSLLDFYTTLVIGRLSMFEKGKTVEDKLKVATALGEYFNFSNRSGDYKFSSNWALGGPLIEHNSIMLEPDGAPALGWSARIWSRAGIQWLTVDGGTPMVAAMRAIVLLNLGDEVPEVPGVIND